MDLINIVVKNKIINVQINAMSVKVFAKEISTI